MYSIIVLGQIPGTNIRISFLAWMYVVGFMIIALCMAKLYLMHRTLVDDGFYTRTILHANQVHQRINLSAR